MAAVVSGKKRKGRKLPKVLSREDAARLVTAPNVKCVTGLRNRVALQLMYRAGLRESEVCDLQPGHVRLDLGYLDIQDGKGGTDRTVPLDPETAELCRTWLAKRPAGDWFLTTTQGTPTTTPYLRNMIRRFSKELGVYVQDGAKRKPVQPHVLRHCCATELLEDGANLEQVRDWLGHSSIQVTAVYLHVRPGALLNIARTRPPMGEVGGR